MATKRQQTMAKIARERAVKEKRALKAEKKQAAREAKAAGITLDTDQVEAIDLNDPRLESDPTSRAESA